MYTYVYIYVLYGFWFRALALAIRIYIVSRYWDIEWNPRTCVYTSRARLDQTTRPLKYIYIYLPSTYIYINTANTWYGIEWTNQANKLFSCVAILARQTSPLSVTFIYLYIYIDEAPRCAILRRNIILKKEKKTAIVCSFKIFVQTFDSSQKIRVIYHISRASRLRTTYRQFS